MFRRSGPGHMLLHTVQKQKVQGRISLSLVKLKAKFAQTEVYKDSPMEKLTPSGVTQLSPQLSLSSIVLMALPCRDFSPPLQTLWFFENHLESFPDS